MKTKRNSEKLNDRIFLRYKEMRDDLTWEKVLAIATAFGRFFEALKIGRQLAPVLKKAPLLAEVLLHALAGKFKIPKAAILKIAAGLAYVMCPPDVIPDVIPVAGLADDVVVIAWIFKTMRATFEAYFAWKDEQTASVTLPR